MIDSESNKSEVECFKGSESWEDYLRIATLHKDVITEGFLSTFRVNILAELYRVCAKSPHSEIFVCKDKQQGIIGFIAISFSTSSFYKDFLLGRGLVLAPQLIGRIFSTDFLKKLLETLLYPLRAGSKDSLDSEILNFCVDPNCQGRGVGNSLFLSAQKTFSENSVATVKIVTGLHQREAQKFYENRGALLVGGTKIHQDTESLIYHFSVGSRLS